LIVSLHSLYFEHYTIEPLILLLNNVEQLKQAIQTAISQRKPDILKPLHSIALDRHWDMSETIKKWAANWPKDMAKDMLDFLESCWQKPESKPLQPDSEPESQALELSSEPQNESSLQPSSCN
jgi:hypothetical protein